MDSVQHWVEALGSETEISQISKQLLMESGSLGIMSPQAAEDIWCRLLICWICVLRLRFCIKDEAQQHFHCCK